MAKIRYAAWHNNARPGDFNFLCHNQANWSSSLNKVIEEAGDPELSDYEGGEVVIYKLTVEEVKRVKVEEYSEEE